MGRNLLSHDMEILEVGGQWGQWGGWDGKPWLRAPCLAWVVSINNALEYPRRPRYPEAHDIRITFVAAVAKAGCDSPVREISEVDFL